MNNSQSILLFTRANVKLTPALNSKQGGREIKHEQLLTGFIQGSVSVHLLAISYGHGQVQQVYEVQGCPYVQQLHHQLCPPFPALLSHC